MRVPRTSLIVLATATAALGASSSAGAATWSAGLGGAAVDLDVPVPGTVNDPRVATTSDGGAVSAWYDTEGPTVKVATRAPGAPWADAIDLTALDPEVDDLGDLLAVDDVQVATGRHGEAVVSWWEDTTYGTIVRVAVRRGAGPWVVSSPSGIDLGDVDDPFPTVADDGTIAVAWVHHNGDSPDGLRIGTLVGDTWSADPETIEGEPNEPRIGYRPDGDLVAAYEDQDTDSVAVVDWHDGVRSAYGGFSQGDASEPDLAVARDGRVAVVWQEDGPSGRAARSAVRSASGAWTTSSISRPDTDVTLPKVAASDDGFVAAWDVGNEAPDAEVDTATLGAGSTWVAPETVAGPLPWNGESDVAVAPDGTATVVWEDLVDDEDALLESRTRAPGGDWEPVQRFASSPTGQSSGPQVAAYGDGSFTAVWRNVPDSDDGHVEAVQASLLDRTGPGIATTVPATVTIGVPLNLSAVAKDLWNDVEAVGWIVDGTPLAPGRDATWTPATLGYHVVRVRAQDTQGNVTEREFAVQVVPVATPPAADVPPAGAPPVVAKPAPTCAAPYVEIVGIRAAGTARTPRVRLTGVAGSSLVGRTVEVRRDGRKVGSAKVRGDRSVVVSVLAPHRAKDRALARYRLVVGSARSRALKATREAQIFRTTRLSGGRVAVDGRVTTVHRATTLTITGTTVCGTAKAPRTTVRTDARGRFRTTLTPSAGAGSATIFRITAPGRTTVSLPIVVVGR